mgnify:CR=1 FL=1
MKKNYRLTQEQKKLLRLKPINGNNNTKYIEKILFKHLLIENGIVDKKEDYLLEKDLNNTLIEYLLNNSSYSYGEAINKYNVSNYYTELAKQFNNIAIKRAISRNNLWEIIKKNIIFKNSNKTELRIYKYIFRGEIIPSPKYVYKTLNENEDLPSYLSIIYLDELISPELEIAYEKIRND